MTSVAVWPDSRLAASGNQATLSVASWSGKTGKKRDGLLKNNVNVGATDLLIKV